VKLNSQSTTSLWLDWQTIHNGATLDFTVGNNPTGWGSNPTDAPPSYGGQS
jgi:hypothetical protein